MLMISTSIISQTTQKVFVKTFKSDKYEGGVYLDIQGSVEYMNWDKPYFRIFTTIVTDHNEEITNKLAQVGRYNYLIEETESMIVLSMPKLNIDVIIKGKYLNESLRIIIKMPYGFSKINTSTNIILN